MSKCTVKKPRVLRKICPICGAYFHTYFGTPNKRNMKTGRPSILYFCSPECKAASYEAVNSDAPRFFGGLNASRKDLEAMDPYKLLALSILSFAVEDYRYTVQGKKAQYDVQETREMTKPEAIEAFFGSEWAEELAMGLYSSREMLGTLQKIRSEQA